MDLDDLIREQLDAEEDECEDACDDYQEELESDLTDALYHLRMCVEQLNAITKLNAKQGFLWAKRAEMIAEILTNSEEFLDQWTFTPDEGDQK